MIENTTIINGQDLAGSYLATKTPKKVEKGFVTYVEELITSFKVTNRIDKRGGQPSLRIASLFCFILVLGVTGFSQDSWETTQKKGTGEVTVYFYDSDHFISEKGGKISGIEFDLLTEFFSFVEKKYSVEVNVNFSKTVSFGDLYQKIKKGRYGEFGACSFSITEERKKEVGFSPKYMPDIEVLISSNNFPITEDTASFIRFFSAAKALSIANTTFDNDIERIKPLLPDVEIDYLKYSSDIKKRISTEPDLFSYIEMPNYILALKKGERLKRQPLFKVEREGYAFIFPTGSDWEEPINSFFTDPSFKQIMNGILRKHLGNDIKDLLWGISDSESSVGQKEISLLTKEREIQQLELEKQQLEIHRQMLVKKVSLAGIAVIVLVAFLLYNRSRMRKKANEMLHKQNEEISLQKQIIEEKNTDIIDSLVYAKRIQENILPTEKQFKDVFSDSFVLYKPKDIVAGDFYFIGLPKNKTTESPIIAVGDCTGHGVPGALLSIIGNTFLQMSLSEKDVTTCAETLDFLNQGLINVLKNEKQTIQDGMDISLCRINLSTMMLEYSGANNPVFIVKGNSLIVTTPDKRAIGQFDYKASYVSFTNAYYQVEKGDSVYLFSDGYADQFGGEKGKKFKTTKLKELLLSIQLESMSNQKLIINKAFEDWKKNHEQVDDVCIIGVKI